MLKVVPAFVWSVEVADIAEGFPEIGNRSGADASEVGLEFRKGHLDGIEVGTVRGQEKKPCPLFLEHVLGTLAFVAGQVVENDDVAGLERGRQLGFDVGFEDVPVHGPINDPRGGQSIAPQSGDECLCFPVPEGRRGPQSLAAPGSAPETCHFGRGGGLVDEDQAFRFSTHARLTKIPPNPALTLQLGAFALAGQQRFF